MFAHAIGLSWSASLLEALLLGSRLSELPMSAGAAITLIVRGRKLVPPEPDTLIIPGDQIYVITSLEERPFIQLMFGRPEEHS